MIMDTNLQFLNKASNNDLLLLCDIVTKDKNGGNRITEGLTSTQAYGRYYPHDINRILSKVVDEFRLFGGNTIANIFRGGEGPEYSEILRDVAKKLKVSFNRQAPDELVERYILQKLFTDTLDRASNEELRAMMDELGYPTTSFTRQAAIATLMTAWRAGGFQSYILLVTVVNAVMRFLIGRGLSLAANAALTRMASIFMGPIGWVLTALWTVVDIAGPAYRVTVPAVIQIAYIRQRVMNKVEMLFLESL